MYIELFGMYLANYEVSSMKYGNVEGILQEANALFFQFSKFKRQSRQISCYILNFTYGVLS